MGNFRNNQRPAANPFYADVAPGFWGLSVIGGMTAVQANRGYDYELSEETEGYATIWPEVIDWPFAQDEEGISFDQANLLGVRTRCVRQKMADGGGDNDDWWVAVPKSRPSGYTAVGRCGILVPLYADHFGDPMNGISWNHRTAGGVLLNTAATEGLLRSQWGPRNRAQLTLGAMIGDAYSGQWEWYGDTNPFNLPDTRYVAAYLATTHVGFRGGKLTFTIGHYGPNYPLTGSRTFEICAVRSDRFWDPFDQDDSDQPEVLTSGTVSWNIPTPTDPVVVQEITLGSMIPLRQRYPVRFLGPLHIRSGRRSRRPDLRQQPQLPPEPPHRHPALVLRLDQKQVRTGRDRDAVSWLPFGNTSVASGQRFIQTRNLHH
jgi:hypothetical protein